MPYYDYQCLVCSKIKEVRHTVAEIDNPSEETLKEITCDCEKNTNARMVKTFVNAPGIRTPTKNRF